jgi:hypothetical protein
MLNASFVTPFGSMTSKPAWSEPVRLPNVWPFVPQPTALTP